MTVSRTIILFLLFFISCKESGNVKSPGPLTNAQKETGIIARCTPSNDYFTTHDSGITCRFVPALVHQRIDEIANKYFYENNLDSLGYQLPDLIGPVYESRVNKGLTIYIFKFKATVLSERYYFIGYNPLSSTIASDHISISGKFMSEADDSKDEGTIIAHPLIFYEDIDGDAISEVVIKERVHNGNVYNAVIQHYYSIVDGLNLRKLISIESISRDPMDENTFLRRKIHNDTIYIDRVNNGTVTRVAEIAIDLKPEIKFLSKTIIDASANPSTLLTASGQPDSHFAKLGY